MINANDIEQIITASPLLKGGKIGRTYQGTRNQCIELIVDQNKFALRLMPPSRLCASSREVEFRIWQECSDRLIAPKLLYISPDFRYCISEWVEGSHAAPDIGLLSYLHQFQGIELTNTPKFDLKVALKSYLDILGFDPMPYWLLWEEDLVRMHEDAINWRLCHNDLTAQNILKIGSEYKLLDFEYAAINHRYFDLASISLFKESDLSLVSHEQLLRFYHQRPATNNEVTQYLGVRRLSLWLGALWARVEEPSWLDRYTPSLILSLPRHQHYLVDQLLS